MRKRSEQLKQEKFEHQIDKEMTRKMLTIIILTAFAINACKELPKQELTQTTKKVDDDHVVSLLTDKDGKKLKVTFNHTNETALVDVNGETIELAAQKAASGIWYINETYELRGKGNDIELTKHGEVIFAHKDDIVTSSLKNKEGETLDITFNHTTNEAKVYVNGGEQIEMTDQKPASGIWYKNDRYELRGKGDNLTLTKDGEIVFKK